MPKAEPARKGQGITEHPIVEQPHARPNLTLELPVPTPKAHALSDLVPYLQPEDQALVTRLKSRLYGREE